LPAVYYKKLKQMSNSIETCVFQSKHKDSQNGPRVLTSTKLKLASVFDKLCF